MYNKFVFNLPKGWKIIKNDFYQIDPTDYGISEEDKSPGFIQMKICC
jgi:hypothetical protein